MAKDLGIHHNTVTSLMKEERQRRREIMPDEDLKAIATYEALMKEAWRRLRSHPDEAKAQNVVGYLNVILGSQNSMNTVIEAKAPEEHNHNVSYRDYTTGGELEELFAEIDRWRSDLDEEGREANSEEPLDTPQAY